MNSPPKGGSIVKAAIFPAIGIARVGNSEEEFFIGPEVTDPQPQPHSYYRSTVDNKLKRQAARFRIYGLDEQNRPVRELTLADEGIQIDWTVHLANRKASWYQFHSPLDIPEAAAAPAALLRNARVQNRSDLIIDGGPRTIGGSAFAGETDYIFAGDRWKFMGHPVYLGELRTDPMGRLLVLGGRGVSESRANPPTSLTGAHNNDTWYDDTSDGPVTATVCYDGEMPLEVIPAWVVVAPPNYAPQQKSVCTMWDVIRDVTIQNPTPGFPPLPFPDPPSFNQDIRPIFERLSNLQWVNAAYAAAFGWGGPHHFSTPDMLSRLSSTADAYLVLRQTIANQFRDPRSPPAGDPYGAATAQLWPWQWGEAYDSATPSPRLYASLTSTQLQMLKVNWVQGMVNGKATFIDDYNPKAAPLRNVEDLPDAEQAEMLTRAALEFCAADALHPGIEMTWNMRSAAMYMPGFPFRIMPVEEGWTEPDLGIVFNRTEVVKVVSPLGPQVPGGLTRWLAVPWQSGAGACKNTRSGPYDPEGYAPAWWPSRVPNHVVTPQNYVKIKDGDLSPADRLAAFFDRGDWISQPPPVLGNIPAAKAGEAGILNGVVRYFGEMGIVATVPGPEPDPRPGAPEFPATLQMSDRESPSTVQLNSRARTADRPR